MLAQDINQHLMGSRRLQGMVCTGSLDNQTGVETVTEIRDYHRLMVELQDEKKILAQRARNLLAETCMILDEAGRMIEKREREDEEY
jgi:hypothetical protein